SVTIPDSVVTIGEYAFYDCDSLISVTIPDSVVTIGEYAFYDCDSLISVIIPDSVTTIEKRTFSRCDSLTAVTIPDSVTSIEDWAFYDCTALESITIENPECEIYDYETTISDTTKIYGYDNSTAQAYAEKYERNFVSLGTAPEKPTTEILTGDANKDGEFNILDIITLQKWLLGAGNLPSWQAMDFNRDGMITIFDFVLAKKYYLKNI
ncbi:MAG: leucine-rich repeat protein, partial [Oscillospiraceae bacterium]|nr:leucine-rich repeat protein [Oscillospiraceae bacterium]